ncbi:MAG TPA: MFS transporter [Pseudomonadota bacterium]|nr:MFS transporter [Pseudomonadota bacterium]
MADLRPAAPTSPLAAAPPRWPFATYRLLTVMALMIGYIGYYLCRANLAAAHGSLHRELGLTNEQFGQLVSVGNAVYAGGKFIGAATTDSVGGRRIFFIGLFGSVIATVGFGATGGLAMLLLFWGLNRAFQSIGWGGLMTVLSRWFTPAQYGSASGALSVSYQFGGVVATLFAGLLLKFGAGWRLLFFGPALALLGLGLVLLPLIKASPLEVGYPLPSDDSSQRAAGPAGPVGGDRLALGKRLRLLLGSGRFLIVCCLSLVLTLLRETFNNWLPAYFAHLGGSAYSAVFKSALFPLLGCVGTILAGWLSDTYFRNNRGPILAGFLAAAGCVLIGLGHPEPVIAWAHQRLGVDGGLVIAAMVGLIGFFVLAPYSMVGGGVFALDYGGRQAAGTAANLLDGVGYTASIFAGIGVGKLLTSASGDWRPVFSLMTWAVFGCAGLSVLLSLLGRTRRQPEF